ncbi:MAG: sodium:proton exchanger, partial [Candidatus Buchananbacteria bacterium RIFCSPHIGHO2_02_FULL_38_8]
MILNIILFAIGLAVSIYGADFLVRGSSSIAKKSGLSPLFIGLTIVAFGTSMPELVVNLFASFKGNNDIAIGNILGSNIANILLILGISSVIYPLTLKKTTIAKEIPFSFLAVLVLFILANDTMMDGLQSSLLSRGDGLVLLGFFVIFMYYTFGISRVTADIDKNEVKIYKYHIAFLMIIGGLLGLVIGGNLLVDSAIALARFLRVSEAFIGLTIVAVGTSLPELATSAVAAFRKSSDIAVGNIVGSNIFNIFWILGISATIRPLYFSPLANFDVFIVMLATLILIPFMFIGQRNILQRSQGAIMVFSYIIYVVYLI